MLWNEFLKFMKKGNSNTTKFFGSDQNKDELGTIITAMANTQGGFIFLGFDLRNYHLIGSQISKQDIEKLVKIHCNPYPVIKLDTLLKNEKEVLIIQVCDSHNKPYYFNNKCFVMDEGQSKLSFLEKGAVETGKQSDESSNEQSIAEDQAVEPVSEHSIEPNEVLKRDIAEVTDDLLELNTEYEQDEQPAELSPVQITEHSQSAFSSHSQDEPIIINEDELQLNERQQQTIEFLKNHDFIKNKKYRELHQVSHKTAHIELVDLVEKGKIECKGSGRSTCYVLKESDQLHLI